MGGQEGTCEPTGSCSFPDPSCSSNKRYGQYASGELANTCVAVSAPPSDASSDADLASLFAGCVLHLKMDEPAWTGSAGEVVDSCGTNTGTALNGATTTANGVRGRAGIFVGGTSCVQVPDAPSLHVTTAMTTSAWILPTTLAPLSVGVISKRTDYMVGTAFSVFVMTDNNGAGNTNQIYVDIDTENDRVADPNAAFLGEWKQITVVYDGSLAAGARVTFYVDGELSFVAPESSPLIGVPATPPPLWIGCLPLGGGPAQGFVGKLDEVVVWNRALDAAEVATWYAATKP